MKNIDGMDVCENPTELMFAVKKLTPQQQRQMLLDLTWKVLETSSIRHLAVSSFNLSRIIIPQEGRT